MILSLLFLFVGIQARAQGKCECTQALYGPWIFYDRHDRASRPFDGLESCNQARDRACGAPTRASTPTVSPSPKPRSIPKSEPAPRDSNGDNLDDLAKEIDRQRIQICSNEFERAYRDQCLKVARGQLGLEAALRLERHRTKDPRDLEEVAREYCFVIVETDSPNAERFFNRDCQSEKTKRDLIEKVKHSTGNTIMDNAQRPEITPPSRSTIKENAQRSASTVQPRSTIRENSNQGTKCLRGWEAAASCDIRQNAKVRHLTELWCSNGNRFSVEVSACKANGCTWRTISPGPLRRVESTSTISGPDFRLVSADQFRCNDR